MKKRSICDLNDHGEEFTENESVLSLRSNNRNSSSTLPNHSLLIKAFEAKSAIMNPVFYKDVRHTFPQLFADAFNTGQFITLSS